MNTKSKYKNRTEELARLINILRAQGICCIEQLSKLLVCTIKSYAAQLHIENLTSYELEYIWLKLVTPL